MSAKLCETGRNFVVKLTPQNPESGLAEDLQTTRFVPVETLATVVPADSGFWFEELQKNDEGELQDCVDLKGDISTNTLVDSETCLTLHALQGINWEVF